MLWLKLGRTSPEALVDARLTLHWAAQIVAAVGEALLDEEDFSHTNLLWEAEHGGFAGRSLAQGHQIFLDPRFFRVGVRDAEESEVAGFELKGSTLEACLEQVGDALSNLGYAVPEDGLRLLEHELPEHPVGEGAAFELPDVGALRELARYFHNAQMVLSQVAEAHGGSEVRCWPHHFDVAILIELDADRSIGVGLSPGDETLAQPYIYVTPWPYPESDTSLPDLPIGRWNRDGWTGALLSGTEIAATSESQAQLQAVEGFIEAALKASRSLLTL